MHKKKKKNDYREIPRGEKISIPLYIPSES